jgi:hypothetical protein
MATKKSKPQKIADIELVDDAWPRFEALVKNAAKMGHKPHETKAASAKTSAAKSRRRAN